ncbi:Na+/H+ antiporter subunit E [Nocardioides flavescens]|uniref:Na+/H+ antiporter subunit E n=1 Tax=Nocardioides flavescens TaxID=2691959 RepID=A0A6L7F0D4_9ACTN|nr:Na+/H+ antiporter subunit E [Nocardioides flavescens]
MTGTGGTTGVTGRGRDGRRGSSVRQRRDGRFRPSRVKAVQWPMVVWLTLVWAVLWGSWTPLSFVSGVVVAVLASVVFPLPPLHVHVRIRPVGVVVLVARFVADVVVASLQVAAITLRPPPDLRSAIVKVPLHTESDLVLTATALMASLVPGSVVVEVHRSTHTLYLHALRVRDEAELEEVRWTVWRQEQRILEAFGVDRLDELRPVTAPVSVEPEASS